MATDGFASRINGVEYAAVDERRMDSALLMPGPVSAPFSARSGRRVNGSGLTVSVGGSPEAWTVSPGAGVIFDPAYASQGAWRFEIPSAVSANLPARPGAGQSRIDLIVARIYDPGALGSGPAEVKIERVAGNSGASPSAPSLPPLSVELDRLTVPASGAITSTKSSAVTVAAGGVLPVPTTDDRTKLVTDGIAYRGLVVDDAQVGALFRYNGDGWDKLAVASASDQPWTNLTAETNWTANTGANAPKVKRVGTRVTYSGGLFGGPAGSTSTTLPSWARPTATVRVAVPIGASGVGYVRVWANGAFQPSGDLGSETMVAWDVA